jgi:hypothetical protein
VFQFFVRLASPPGPAQGAPTPRAALSLVQQRIMLPTRLEGGSLGALGEWAALVPDDDGAFPLVDVASATRSSVLFFGRLDDFCRSPGERLLQAYSAGGVEAVHRLGGVFCALIVDADRAEAVLVTDVVGQRAPRFLERDGALFVASHELVLHAVAREPLALDAQSALSLLACDWSLGGHSLYQGIGRLQSGTYLRWSGGRLEARALPFLGVDTRLDPRDERGISECVESVIEILRSSVRHGLAAEARMPRALSLTAGLDSRTILALALSEYDARNLVTVTRGGQRSQDVFWARRVAQVCGVEHRLEAEPAVEPDHFIGNAQLMALATDGMGNAKRACSEAESPSRFVPLGGEGGETLRGYYYEVWRRQHGRQRPLDATATPAEIGAALARKMRSRLRSTLDGAHEPPLQRLEEAIAHVARFSRHTADQLDLYYILERYRHWASQRWRQTWRNAWCAFSPAAIAAAYRLPVPVGRAGIAEAVMRRYLPTGAYWLPVNGYRLLPLHGNAPWSRLAQLSLKRAYAGWRTLQPLPSESPDARRGALFAGPLFEVIDGAIRSAGSVATTVLGPAGVQRLLDEQRATQRHTEALGVLVTADLYVSQARELRRLASSSL